MHFIKAALSLAFLAGSALAQSTQLTLPPPGSTLTAGSEILVQVGMGGYPENIDVVAIVIGLMPCYGGECFPASSFMGDILYQGPYTPPSGGYYANYTCHGSAEFPHWDFVSECHQLLHGRGECFMPRTCEDVD
ncbi:hypothetical protein J3R83DRAFT_11508 [Lanmaoa asiatica]|nr:hypothetical protein J3R83DRAFT_11508 [Lanmaoa asiatica]